jgi:hypothetical protein
MIIPSTSIIIVTLLMGAVILPGIWTMLHGYGLRVGGTILGIIITEILLMAAAYGVWVLVMSSTVNPVIDAFAGISAGVLWMLVLTPAIITASRHGPVLITLTMIATVVFSLFAGALLFSYLNVSTDPSLADVMDVLVKVTLIGPAVVTVIPVVFGEIMGKDRHGTA